MTVYYNEFDPYAAQWLRNLIAAGHIAPGVVDERSIVDVTPADIRGFTQVHLFAGIGGWSLAARLAGWSDNRPLWTGYCPCQPFSVAGKQAGTADARHLWPEMFRLISACRPDVVMGEQVAAAVGKSWLDGVCSNLESIGYACGAAVVPACAVDAPHRRDRLWFVADCADERCFGVDPLLREDSRGRQPSDFPKSAGGRKSHVANDAARRCSGPEGWQGEQPRRTEAFGAGNSDGALGDGNGKGLEGRPSMPERRNERSAWAPSMVITGADGKARRVKPGVRLLAHGVPARVGKLRAFGNAIVPQVAAEIIATYMDCCPT